MIKLKYLILKEINNKWKSELYQRFPKIFADEILNERPNGTEEDRKEISGWILNPSNPMLVKVSNLLKNNYNSSYISHTPKQVIDHINRIWGMNIQPKQIYDIRPERYFQYAKMPASTANPSILINGKIYWGVGRFIASVIRKDASMKVWNVVNKN